MPALRTTAVRCLALAFLLLNLVVRTSALGTAGGAWIQALGALVFVAALLCSLRPSLLGAALFLFGASFLLYGFHSYRVQSQVFEYGVTALALALLLRKFAAESARANWPLRFWSLYLLLALFSLLLLPVRIVSHRFLLEGWGVFPHMLALFPRDPLYALAGVNRLALFVLFAVQLSRGESGAEHCRALMRGVAWGAVACVLLGLLDFFGLVSLASQNLSRLFYGSRYPRLQSTFGNPTWFASFITCTLPLVILELRAWSRVGPALTGAFLPLCAAALFLSEVRASWLACGLLLALVLVFRARGETWASLSLGPAGGTRGRQMLWGGLASLLVLGVLALGTRPGGGAGRLGGVTREMQLRGVTSVPRTVVLEQGLAVARESVLLGSGYETFNLHLRALLGIPASGVARVPNPAAAADERDAVFDDAHSTYVQILAGTGLLGLACWLTLGAVSLLLLAGERGDPASPAPWVGLSMIAFHVYGLFQGMEYIPVVFFLFPLMTGYAMTLDPGRGPSWLPRAAQTLWAVLAGLVLLSPLYYWHNRGFRNLKDEYGLSAYLPEEGAQFEGFFPPEAWLQGEFRWMGRRGLVNVGSAGPLKLRLACSQPHLEGEPVLVSFFFNGRPAGTLRFEHPGMLEKTFQPDGPGVLLLTASRTWRPRDEDPTGDTRELGVAVSLVPAGGG